MNHQNIGARFYSDESNPNAQPNTFLQENAHIGSLDFLIDTTNWVHIDGWFVADSAYTWIGLGNYFGVPYDPEELLGVFPTGYTQNYLYIDDVCVTMNPSDCNNMLVAVEESNTNDIEFKVFPNPVIDQLRISLSANQRIYEAIIKDISGRIIHKESFQNSGIHTFDVAACESGIYLLQLREMGSSHAAITKFIKE